ncbi:MAG TPA: hypothetical protein VF592_04020 [Sphingomonas sp.]|uniref:hypothetical protein n=1 Tax=Sphingomonas sp. TaxID=28214 RepID=UPI002ED80A8B
MARAGMAATGTTAGMATARIAARFTQARWIVPAIMTLALALRLAIMLVLPQQPVSDSLWYLDRAADLVRGLGYQEKGHPTAFWPVGYPALLAASQTAFGPSLLGPLLLNLAAAAATLALILWFARHLGAGELAARLAALLYALYPAHIVYAGQTASETTSTALAMAAFALLIAGRRRAALLVAAGLLFGAATLMRAQLLLFPIGAIVALMIVYRDVRWRDGLRVALLVHLALAAVVAPWTWRNWRELGAFVPVSTNGGIALYYGANDRTTGGWYAWERTPVWDQVVPIPYAQRVERQVELDRHFKVAATRWIADHPGRWTALGVRKVALLWLKDSDAFWGLHATYPARSGLWRAVQALNQLFYLALLALAAVALWTAGRARWRGPEARWPLLLLGCMPAFATLTAFAFTGQIRYHYSAMPFLIVAAGWTLARLLAPHPAAHGPLRAGVRRSTSPTHLP